MKTDLTIKSQHKALILAKSHHQMTLEDTVRDNHEGSVVFGFVDFGTVRCVVEFKTLPEENLIFEMVKKCMIVHHKDRRELIRGNLFLSALCMEPRQDISQCLMKTHNHPNSSNR